MHKKILLVFILSMSSLLLTACFDVEQEYWINDDGSGKFRMDLGVSESLLAMDDYEDDIFSIDEMEEAQSSNPYITNFVTREYSEEGYRHYSITADISDMQTFFGELQDLSDIMGGAGILITLEETSNGNWLFHQTLNMSDAALGDDTLDGSLDDLSRGMLAGILGDSYWNVKLHVDNIVNTNGKWDEETNTVEWNISMAEIFTGDNIDMTAEYKPAFAWKKYIIPIVLMCFVGIFVVISIAVIFFLYLRQQNKETAQVISG